MNFTPSNRRRLSKAHQAASQTFFGCPLPDLPTGRTKLDRAAAWLGRLEIDWARLAPYVAFDRDGYVRRTITVEDEWEVVLCAWLPQQGTAMHGHGDAVGVIRLLAGTLTEAACGPTGSVMSRRFLPGAILREDRGVVHQVVNCGETPALSLHLYHPPLLQGAAPRRTGPGLLSGRGALP